MLDSVIDTFLVVTMILTLVTGLMLWLYLYVSDGPVFVDDGSVVQED